MCAVAQAQVKSNDVGAKHFAGAITIFAKPQTIFTMLTNCEKHCTLVGMKHISGARSFAKVGNAAYLCVEGSDSGMQIVTCCKPNKELRLTFEPDNGCVHLRREMDADAD